MSSDPVDPPTTQAPRPSYQWQTYGIFPDTELGLEGPGLFTLAVHHSDGSPFYKFAVDRVNFKRHSSVFKTILSGGQFQLGQKCLKLVVAQDGTDVVELEGDDNFVQGLRLVIRAIYDPSFLAKELRDRLEAMGKVVNPGTPHACVAWELITDLRAILDISTTLDFFRLKDAVIGTLTRDAFNSSATLARLCPRMQSAQEESNYHYNAVQVVIRKDWRVYLERVLSLAHDHKLYLMIPGIYYLLLALHGPKGLGATKSIPASDRLRSSSAYFDLLRSVKQSSPGNIATASHTSLLEFSFLRNDEQARIWEALPAAFQLGSWDDLKAGKLSNTVEA